MRGIKMERPVKFITEWLTFIYERVYLCSYINYYGVQKRLGQYGSGLNDLICMWA